ncbi:D-alanyl-D-alanine carboxypeptidase/D-alanyl-D-alanine-endopeptidase [bacterium]|nr:D-alanyl-D-alanine carboxypeptidase/D-alanyl-D-alanine-endopeptidase [bacterium]
MRYYLLAILLLFSWVNLPSLSLAGHFKPVTKNDVGVAVYDVSEKKLILSHNYDKKFSYASNLKLLTTAATLHYLGGGFRFVTLFHFDKTTGTLSIKAGGDPSVTYAEIDQIAYELHAKGVKNIKKVVVDNTMFGPRGAYPIPGGGSGDNAYLAFLSPLSLEMNALDISVKATEAGKLATVTLSASEPHIVLVNSARGTADGENRLIVGTTAKESKTVVIVKGSLGTKRRKGVSVSRRIAHPALRYVSALLMKMGEKEKTPILFESLSMELFSSKIVVRHQGRPLREILRIMNLNSSNMMADSLVFLLGVIFKGEAKKGVKVLQEYAKNTLLSPVNIINGSGLGNGKNLITPHFFIALLTHITSQKNRYIDFVASLPVMGEDGTLKRWGTAAMHGNVRAKTGTLTGVTALSGFMYGKEGKLYLFTFVVNNFPAKRFTPTWKFRDAFLDYIRERL